MVLRKTYYASQIQTVKDNVYTVREGAFKLPSPKPKGLIVGGFRVVERGTDDVIFLSQKQIDMQFEEADSY